jgi:antitoxin component of RelBE/YafQ-DinJ toxin-antitoxin module
MNNEVDFSVRVNKDLKNECVVFCNENSITLTDFLKAFIEETVINGKLPFPINQIKNNESSNGRVVSKIHIRFNDGAMMDEFRKICDNFFLTYSVAIKAYMRMCLERNEIICKKKSESGLYNSRNYVKFTSEQKED